MGKVKIPARTVDVCDFCGCQGTLEKCECCGKEYCSPCRATMPGCIHQPDLCKKCGRTAAAQDITEKFAQPLLTVLRARAAAYRRRKVRILKEIADQEAY